MASVDPFFKSLSAGVRLKQPSGPKASATKATGLAVPQATSSSIDFFSAPVSKAPMPPVQKSGVIHDRHSKSHVNGDRKHVQQVSRQHDDGAEMDDDDDEDMDDDEDDERSADDDEADEDNVAVFRGGKASGRASSGQAGAGGGAPQRPAKANAQGGKATAETLADEAMRALRNSLGIKIAGRDHASPPNLLQSWEGLPTSLPRALALAVAVERGLLSPQEAQAAGAAGSAGSGPSPAVAAALSSVQSAHSSLRSHVLSVVEDSRYKEPTPVQMQAIPCVLQGGLGQDTVAVAPTGSGKTAAYTIPLLMRLQARSRVRTTDGSWPGPRALVLAPTKDLAVQIGREIGRLGADKAGLKVAVLTRANVGGAASAKVSAAAVASDLVGQHKRARRGKGQLRGRGGKRQRREDNDDEEDDKATSDDDGDEELDDEEEAEDEQDQEEDSQAEDDEDGAGDADEDDALHWTDDEDLGEPAHGKAQSKGTAGGASNRGKGGYKGSGPGARPAGQQAGRKGREDDGSDGSDDEAGEGSDEPAAAADPSAVGAPGAAPRAWACAALPHADVVVATPLLLVAALRSARVALASASGLPVSEIGALLPRVAVTVLDEGDRLLGGEDSQGGRGRAGAGFGAQVDEVLQAVRPGREALRSWWEQHGVSTGKEGSGQAEDSSKGQGEDKPGKTKDKGKATAPAAPSQASLLATHLSSSSCLVLTTATLPGQVRDVANSLLRHPTYVTVGSSGHGGAATNVSQKLLYVGREDGKIHALRDLLAKGVATPAVVFVASQERAEQVASILKGAGQSSAVLHGGIPETAREAAVTRFRRGEASWLVTTDVAARGMDYPAVRFVLSLDFPPGPAAYVHRVGRTGRGGRPGEALTLFAEDDLPALRSVASVLRATGCEVPDWMLTLKKTSQKDKAAWVLAQGSRRALVKGLHKGKGRHGHGHKGKGQGKKE